MKSLRRIPPLLIISILLSIGVGFAYTQLYGMIVKKNADIGAAVRQLSGVSGSEEQLLTLKKTLGDSAKKWEKASSYVLGTNGVVEFIQKIETHSHALGVEIEISSLTENAPKDSEILSDSLELLNVQFVASGDWEDLLQLLVFLESMPVATRVNDVQLKKIGEAFTKTGPWNGFFNLVALKKK